MTRRTAIGLATCLALACKPGGARTPDVDTKAELPPAPTPTQRIEILMAGKPPHSPLRFAAGDAKEQRVVLWRYFSKLGTNVSEYANTSERMTLVASVGPGEHHGSFSSEIGAFGEEGETVSPVARVEIGPRGPIRGYVPVGDRPHLSLLDRVMAGFPEDAVGEGAVWQTLINTAGGGDLRVTTELVDIDHDTLHLKGESSLVGGPPPETKTSNVTTGTVVHGEFEVWWKTGEPLPERGRLKERRTTYHPKGADTEILEITLEQPGQPLKPEAKAGW